MKLNEEEVNKHNELTKKLRDYIYKKPLSSKEMEKLFSKDEIEFMIINVIVWKEKLENGETIYLLY